MLRKKAKDSAAARKPRGSVISIIGADMVISGDVTAAEELRLDGRIEGDLSCGVLHQGPGGAVEGNIVAEEARLAGRVEGAVTAARLVLEPSARISGDVTYEMLSVAGGARVAGRFAHREALGAGQASSTAPVTELFPQVAAE